MSVWKAIEKIGKSIWNGMEKMRDEMDAERAELSRRYYTDDELKRRYKCTGSLPKKAVIRQELESRGYSFGNKNDKDD